MFRVVIRFSRLSNMVTAVPSYYAVRKYFVYLMPNHQRPGNNLQRNFFVLYSVYRLNFISKKLQFNAQVAHKKITL